MFYFDLAIISTNFATSMKEFLQVLRRFVPPYKKYLALSVLFNILSAVLKYIFFCSAYTYTSNPI